ncbi:TMEM165/GDT1 family protein [Jutongia sp.]
MLLFFQIMFTEFIAEMGDKTQLMLVALTSRFKLRDIIIGTAAAILVLNGLAVLLGGFVSELIPTWLIRLIAAAAFLFFAITSLKGDDEEEEAKEENVSRFAPLTVFCTFFVAELGDKTQLTAITFGANEGMNAAVTVWLACSIGLFAADILGMLIGYLLKSKTPDGLLNTLAFFIFAIFGNITMHEGLGLLLGKNHPAVFPVTMIIAVLFILASTFVFMKRIHRDKAEPNE